MIHRLLLSLDKSLPLYPPAGRGGGRGCSSSPSPCRSSAGPRGRSSSPSLPSSWPWAWPWGSFGLDRPAGIRSAGGRRRPGRGHRSARAPSARWEQVTAAGIALAAGLLYAVYNMAFQPEAGRAGQAAAGAGRGRHALGSAHLCRAQDLPALAQARPAGLDPAAASSGGRRASGSGPASASAARTSPAAWPSLARRARARPSASSCRPSPTGCATATAWSSPTSRASCSPTSSGSPPSPATLLFVHNPSDPAASCAVNLCDWVDHRGRRPVDGRRAAVRRPRPGRPVLGQGGDQPAGRLRPALPQLRPGPRRPRRTCTRWPGTWPGARRRAARALAADFTGSMRTQDPKLALNIMAEAFNVGLAPWADPAVRDITSHTDLDLAAQLASVPTVLILRCARGTARPTAPTWAPSCGC